ncbi:MAG: hypothetical protein E7514_06085 [Ruminococcaceae bacterium]|nr:hypothetical protein [Oscillospiraceae bacterium]
MDYYAVQVRKIIHTEKEKYGIKPYFSFMVDINGLDGERFALPSKATILCPFCSAFGKPQKMDYYAVQVRKIIHTEKEKYGIKPYFSFMVDINGLDGERFALPSKATILCPFCSAFGKPQKMDYYAVQVLFANSK